MLGNHWLWVETCNIPSRFTFQIDKIWVKFRAGMSVYWEKIFWQFSVHQEIRIFMSCQYFLDEYQVVCKSLFYNGKDRSHPLLCTLSRHSHLYIIVSNEWMVSYDLNKVGLWVNLFSSGWWGSVENVSITNAMQLFSYSETIFRFVLFISVNQNAKILKNDWITEKKILPNLKHLDWRRSLNKDL